MEAQRPSPRALFPQAPHPEFDRRPTPSRARPAAAAARPGGGTRRPRKLAVAWIDLLAHSVDDVVEDGLRHWFGCA